MDVISTNHGAAIALLSQAACAFTAGRGDRPSPEATTQSLLSAEKTTRQTHTTLPFVSLIGRWRLCFTTGTRKVRGGGVRPGKGFYLPGWLPAFIEFSTDQDGEMGRISNQVQLGALSFKLTGPCRYLSKKNLLAFDFTEMQVQVGGRSLYRGNIRGGPAAAQNFPQRAIAKLPFFAFFTATEHFIAARGRGGGLALWVREEGERMKEERERMKDNEG